MIPYDDLYRDEIEAERNRATPRSTADSSAEATPAAERPRPVKPVDCADPRLLDPVADALAAMAAGRPVVVVDDEDRENEGDLIAASQLATPALAFMIRHTSGVICAPMVGPTSIAWRCRR